MPSIFVTGSNRGLGLEWVRQFAHSGWRVFASCRHPGEALELMQLAKQYPMVSIHHLDVTIPEDIRAIVWEMEGKPIDILINNAGIYLEKGTPEFGCLRYYEWARTLAVNTLGGYACRRGAGGQCGSKRQAPHRGYQQPYGEHRRYTESRQLLLSFE